MSKILAVPPKSISAKDKEAATKAGFIVIEVADPTKIIVIDEHQILSGNDLALVAMDVLATSNYSDDRLKGTFVNRLNAKLQQKTKP